MTRQSLTDKLWDEEKKTFWLSQADVSQRRLLLHYFSKGQYESGATTGIPYLLEVTNPNGVRTVNEAYSVLERKDDRYLVKKVIDIRELADLDKKYGSLPISVKPRPPRNGRRSKSQVSGKRALKKKKV